MVRSWDIGREEVKETLGSVCDVCEYWGNCEKSDEKYYDGCEQFKLALPECSIPCNDCYLKQLGCEGLKN